MLTQQTSKLFDLHTNDIIEVSCSLRGHQWPLRQSISMSPMNADDMDGQKAVQDKYVFTDDEPFGFDALNNDSYLNHYSSK